MADLLPVFLKLKGRKCVVVGAGTIGCQKLAGLLESCADVHVVGSVADAEMQGLARNGWPGQ
jgi:siroheme synthase (precorrin-2 oxidase/ferrochelatase)